MRHIYVIAALMVVLGVVSAALAFTSMQLQSLVSETKSFKEKVIEVNNMLKQENEQLRYQMQGLMARIQSGSSPSVKNPVPEDLSEIPMVTIAKGRISGVTEEKNLVIRSSDEFTHLWDEIYSVSGKPPVPEIDFASATLLAAFNGERPNACHDIMIKKVEVISDEHFGSEKVATVIRTEPSADAACEEVPTQAYHIVAIPFSLEDITFDTWVEKVN